MRQTALNLVFELAKRDPRVVFIGSDLGAGVLDDMRRAMPDRFFMEGVCEANVIGMAAGLAMDGYIPYVNTIATFLTRRCYEQIAIDLCAHNLPVRLIASGGGVVYAPLGPTHLALEDIAILRALPNMTVTAPVDAEEMARLTPLTLDYPGPIYMRLAKGGDAVTSRAEAGFAIGRAIMMRPLQPGAAGTVLAVSTGVMSTRALQAADTLAAQGVGMGVLHMHTVKPLDEAAIIAAAAGVDMVVTIEEHTRIGGLGSAVADCLMEQGGAPPILRLALPDAFPDDYGTQDHLLERAGLDPAGIVRQIAAALDRRDGGAGLT
jgi:transketolase